MQGTVPLTKVINYAPTCDTRLTLYTRRLLHFNTSPLGYAFRDSSKVTYPIHATGHVRCNTYTHAPDGVTIKANFATSSNAYTYTAHTSKI